MATTHLPTSFKLDNADHVAFLLQDTTYAPMRVLYPLTVGIATIMGFGLGLGLGGITDAVPYYALKESLLAAIGGIIAPPLLLLIRHFSRVGLGRTHPSRALSSLFYYLAGGLAGVVMIGASLLLPARIPPGFWLVFYPLGAAGLFPIVGLCADFVQEQTERHERTKEIFGKYVSESIARRILATHTPISLEGEKRKATVLISDIRGFTRLVKDLGPEEVVRTLNEYFARMIDVIFQYDGTVNKFIGDAIVVLYGAPLSTGDDSAHALETAHAMQREVGAMNAARVARGLTPLHIGIAIDAGEVVCGNVGSPRRLEYTAIGEPVNTAYYLAGLAPAGTIYVTENVHCDINPVTASRKQRIALKGGTGETTVYILADAPIHG